MTVLCEVSTTEFLQVQAALTPIFDEYRGLAKDPMVILQSRAGNWLWRAGTPSRLAEVAGNGPAEDFAIAFGAELLDRTASIIARTATEDSITIEIEDRLLTFNVGGSAVSGEFADEGTEIQPIRVTETSEGSHVAARVDLGALHGYLRAVRPPASVPADEWSAVVLRIDKGQLSVTRHWSTGWDGGAVIATEAADSAVAVVPVNPDFLLAAIACSSEPTALLELPADPSWPLIVTIGSCTTAIAPVMTRLASARQRVGTLLGQVFGPHATMADADGDHLLSGLGQHIWAHVVDDDLPRVTVFAPVLHDVPASPELLEELNDYALRLSFARCYHVDDAVWVSVDLLAETLDEPEIRHAYDTVRFVTTELGPALSTVFGGVVPADPDIERLQMVSLYQFVANTGGTVASLTGPETDLESFGGPCWFVTAEAPYGRPLPMQLDHERASRLGAELLASGGRVRQARAIEPSGRVLDGYVVDGVQPSTVCAIAATAGQDWVVEFHGPSFVVLDQSGSPLTVPIDRLAVRISADDPSEDTGGQMTS